MPLPLSRCSLRNTKLDHIYMRLIETRAAADRFWEASFKALSYGLGSVEAIGAAMKWSNEAEAAILNHERKIRGPID